MIGSNDSPPPSGAGGPWFDRAGQHPPSHPDWSPPTHFAGQSTFPTFAVSGPLPRDGRGRFRGLVALAGAIVVAAAAVIGAVVYRSATSGAAPAEVVDRYLHALAAGDASTALSLGAATPASTAWLSDDVLKQQLQKLPITDVRIDGETSTPATRADRVYVKASAAFGGKRSEGLIEVVISEHVWKLGSAFVNAHAGPGHRAAGSAFDTLDIFGKPLPDSATAPMFPGAVSVSSSNPFFAVSQPAPIGLDRLQYGVQGSSLSPVFSINEVGKQALAAAVTKWITACFTPGAPPEGPCIKIDPTVRGMYVPGSARLTGPIDLGKWTYVFDQSLSVAFYSDGASIPFTAQRTADGVTEPLEYRGFTTPVDISKNPPVVVAPPAVSAPPR